MSELQLTQIPSVKVGMLIRRPPAEVATYVQVTETGLSGDGDQLVARAAGSTGGFTIALCALKALLEHDVDLSVVRDRSPEGLPSRGGS